jgi:type IV secretion system protein TrbI
VTDAPHEEAAGPVAGERPPQEMRLRSSRAPVTRLSRKVLLGLGTVAAVGIGGALFLALQPQHQTTGSELYNTNNRTTPDGLANLPRDYAGLPRAAPQLGPPLPGDLGRPIANAGAPAPGMPTPAVAPDPGRAPATSSRRPMPGRSPRRPFRRRQALKLPRHRRSVDRAISPRRITNSLS